MSSHEKIKNYICKLDFTQNSHFSQDSSQSIIFWWSEFLGRKTAHLFIYDFNLMYQQMATGSIYQLLKILQKNMFSVILVEFMTIPYN